MPKSRVVHAKTVNPHTLQPHPLNAKLYGKEKLPNTEMMELAESIRANGILVPLLITRKNVVVSGHRRLHWALADRLETVPVEVLETDDEEIIQTTLIHANRQRSKTNIQKSREAKRLLAIEKARAKERQKEGGKNKVPRNLGEPKLEAADVVGKALGVSGDTAKKLAEVADAIDEAEEAGDTERADELTTALSRSVDSAHKKAKPKKVKASPKDTLTATDSARLDRLKTEWKNASDAVKKEFRKYIKAA